MTPTPVVVTLICIQLHTQPLNFNLLQYNTCRTPRQYSEQSCVDVTPPHSANSLWASDIQPSSPAYVEWSCRFWRLSGDSGRLLVQDLVISRLHYSNSLLAALLKCCPRPSGGKYIYCVVSCVKFWGTCATFQWEINCHFYSTAYSQKIKCQEETHTVMGRTYKLHTERPRTTWIQTWNLLAVRPQCQPCCPILHLLILPTNRCIPSCYEN